MDKLKKSAVAKTAAAIVLAVSILVVVVSGFVVVMAFSYGNSRQTQADAVYDEYMGKLVEESASSVQTYYQEYLQEIHDEKETGENHVIRYYEDYFDEENSNFFFGSCRTMQRNIRDLQIMNRRGISFMPCCHSRRRYLPERRRFVASSLCRI